MNEEDKMATYNEIRSNIKTGDIVLFSGKGGVSPSLLLYKE
jgi:cell shape-determining protein MreC